MLLATLIAAAFASQPSRVRPITAAERAAVIRVVREQLADPSSAQFQWFPVRPGSLYCGRVNARNRLGGYVGFQPYLIIFNERLSDPLPYAMVGEADPRSPATQTILSQCHEQGYEVDAAPH